MKDRGFTVIEMLVMVGLMAVVLVVGFNTFGMYQGRNRQNLRDISTQFYRDFSLMRMDAVAQNIPMMIRFAEDTTMAHMPGQPTPFMYSFFRYNVVSNTWDNYNIDSGRGVHTRRCGSFVGTTDNTLTIAFDAGGMVVDHNNMTIPRNHTFTLFNVRGDYQDEHDVEIFPSGGIHVTKELDEE